MTIYSFKITKGKYQLSLTTTDRDMVVEEFEKWVQKASAYVKNHKKQEAVSRVNNQINTEKELTQRRVEEQLKHTQQSKPEIEEPKLTKEEETQKNLDTFYAPQQEEQEQPQEVKTQPQANINTFENLLDKTMQAPQSELSFKPNPSIKKDNSFLNYISGRKIERKIDYLLLTAYYFTQYEQKPRFTLKQLNAKLMQNLAVILDHSVIQEAINRDYIECLPDLTGVVGASEYRLTAYGEKTLLEEG